MRANLGWNTWDVFHVNGLVHLESGIRVRFMLRDSRSGECKERFDWQNDLRRLGPHSGRALGYARIELGWQGSTLALEYAAELDRLVCKVTPLTSGPHQLVAVIDHVWDAHMRQSLSSNGLRIFCGGTAWSVVTKAAHLVEMRDGEFVFELSQPVWFDVTKDDAPISGTADEVLADLREDYTRASLKTAGWLKDSAEGLTRSIHWNTIWEPLKGRVCTPVSREWCANDFWGGYVLFDWDTFFCGLMAALESPELGADNFRAILQEITPRGFVPNFGSARAASLDRSQPPVGAYCVLKAWRGLRLAATSERRALLEETYVRLLRWHQWWMQNRDGNQDGLLEWGSDLPGETLHFETHTLRAAMYESGLDNSPMYDEAVYNPATNTMELADVGLNALYALDAWALSEIAAEIGNDEDARQLHEEFVDLAERINRNLWNEETGIYQNRAWDGSFSPHLSPTNFYPLIAGIVPPERAERMVREHLLNEREFWGEFVLPSISRADSGYRQKEILREGVSEVMNDYWRGRIWGPMNFLVGEGLRRYGFDLESHQFARKCVRLFLKEWQSENHVHENYNDLTGEGDDVPSANALYHWGALLAYIGIQELADCEPWEGWRFGSLDSEPARVEGVQLEEGRLSVTSGPDGLIVRLDQKIMLWSKQPVIVRGYRTEAGRIQFRLSGEVEQTLIRIGLPDSTAGAQVKTRIGQIFEMGHVQTMHTDEDGSVEIALPIPCEVEVIW